MQHSRSVTIGPEFFAKAFNDYADWHWSLAREYLQNCLDAPGTQQIEVTLQPEGNDTLLVVANDGAPMTEDILVGKLLALGGSGKDFNGAVGGFGRAKELCLFCHKSYEVHTGKLLVTGAGANYDLTVAEYLTGTRSSVLVAGNLVDVLQEQFQRFISLSNWKGQFTLNGQVVRERLARGKLRRELSWAKVYTNPSHSNLLVVSIGGMPMFTRHTSYPGCVVVELTGRSGELLQSSRDGLKWPYGRDLDELVQDLGVNRRKALQEPQVEIRHYPGYKLQAVVPSTPQQPEPCVHNEAQAGQGLETILLRARCSSEGTTALGASTQAVTGPSAAAAMAFIIKNDTGLRIPRYFLPEGFGGYAQRLLSRWRDILLELARLTGRDEEFSLGFYFAADLEAAYERGQRWGHIVYVNPAVVRQQPGRPRSFAKRWKFDARGNWQLLATAIHEWCHLEGFGGHDEAFACRQTDLTTLVLQHLKRFGRLFDRGGGK